MAANRTDDSESKSAHPRVETALVHRAQRGDGLRADGRVRADEVDQSFGAVGATEKPRRANGFAKEFIIGRRLTKEFGDQGVGVGLLEFNQGLKCDPPDGGVGFQWKALEQPGRSRQQLGGTQPLDGGQAHG